jgi:NAD+ synthase
MQCGWRNVLLKEELDLVEAKRKIIDFIKKEVMESKTDGVVLGLSGGIDSSVTAYLSVEALGARRVMGLIMPDLRVTPKQDLDDAQEVASELCIETRSIDIAPIHRTFMKNLEPDRLAEGNLRARVRMALLYYHSNRLNRLVVGTGDRSEILTGYFTKGGDGGVDILPIADLYKTEVRRLGETLGLSRRIITKRSSPRLWPGHEAEAELGLSYDAIDSVLKLYFDSKVGIKAIASRLKLDADVVESLIWRYQETAHKRQPPPICKVR